MTERQDPKSPGAVDVPPDGDQLTAFDRAHLTVYLRLLDAEPAKIEWRISALDILGVDPSEETANARRIFDAFCARARWMTRVGYRLMTAEPKR